MERPLTDRQKHTLVTLAQERSTSYDRRSCPSLLRRGLVRDTGGYGLARWAITEKGLAAVGEIHAEYARLSREGRL